MMSRDRQRLGWGRRAAAAGVAASMVFAAGCDHETGDGGEAAPIKVETVLGGLGDTPGRLAYPRCVEPDAGPDGDGIWVIDKSSRIQRLDVKTGACTVMFRTPENASGNPVGVTIARGRDASGAWKDGMMYVADAHYHRVLIYDPPRSVAAGAKPEIDLKPVRSIGTYGTGPGEFYFPTDVAVVPAAGGGVERIYVAEYGGNDRVSVFDGDFKFLFAFGTLGPGKDEKAVEFSRPQAVQVWNRSDGSRELVVLDLGNHRLGRFTMDGKLIAWIGRPGGSAAGMGGGLGEFNLPQGLRVLEDGTALVTEFGGCRVQLVDLASGKGIRAWGRPGRGDGELANPWDCAVIGREVFVLDSGNNRVVGFRK